MRNFIIDRILIYFWFSVGLSFLFGCENKNIIDEEKFVQIYAEWLTSSEADSSSSVSNLKLNKILEKYQVDFKEYQTTIEYYNQDSQRWERFFTKTLTYLENQKKAASK